MPSPLEQRWCELWRRLEAKGEPLPTFHLLAEHYSEPHRAYHTLRHIEECLDELDTTVNEATDRLAVGLALWFHDIIYDPHRSDNEEQSAALLLKLCAGTDIGQKSLAASRDLIVATKTHSGSGYPYIPLMVDIDLSILRQEQRALRRIRTPDPAGIFLGSRERLFYQKSRNPGEFSEKADDIQPLAIPEKV